ncbi:MAG: hypothetical protein NTV08_01975 [Verrucomicrobia bacterium]|nr:hypothetical protein [Verrucomicrobiota bacterium]
MKPTATVKPELVRDIIATLKSLPDRLPRGAGGGTEWTALLKTELRRVGHEHEYLVSPCPDDGNKEWLYDLIWFRNDSNNQLREVAMVLESEWSNNEWHIQEDFEKLLVAKAPIKVMAFESNLSELPKRWCLLKDGIRVFEKQSTDETYILAGFKTEDHEFEIQVVDGAEQK